MYNAHGRTLTRVAVHAIYYYYCRRRRFVSIGTYWNCNNNVQQCSIPHTRHRVVPVVSSSTRWKRDESFIPFSRSRILSAAAASFWYIFFYFFLLLFQRPSQQNFISHAYNTGIMGTYSHAIFSTTRYT